MSDKNIEPSHEIQLFLKCACFVNPEGRKLVNSCVHVIRFDAFGLLRETA